jgi:hypothetical protein
MKTNVKVAGLGLLFLATVASLVGCKSASNQMTASGAAHAAEAGAMAASASLVDQMGGMNNVLKLADAFGSKISSNQTLNKTLDAATITQTKQGLVNEIAKASGMTPPTPGVDLNSALSGKGLDASGVSALTSSLSAAAGALHLNGVVTQSLMALIGPILQALLPH